MKVTSCYTRTSREGCGFLTRSDEEIPDVCTFLKLDPQGAEYKSGLSKIYYKMRKLLSDWVETYSEMNSKCLELHSECCESASRV